MGKQHGLSLRWLFTGVSQGVPEAVCLFQSVGSLQEDEAHRAAAVDRRIVPGSR